MAAGHRVIVQHDRKRNDCYAWCQTCFWRGPRVKRTKTAEGWAEKHAPTYQGRHRATATP